MGIRKSSGICGIIVPGILFLLMGCVERIQFDIPAPQTQIFLEGMISDSPGPYVVKVSQGLNLNEDSIVRVPIRNLKIRLYDDHGNTETFIEGAPGDYYTGGTMRGQIGYSYHITIETPDGKTYESEPDLLKPVGVINKISYEYDSREKEEKFGIVKQDVFNILIDAEALEGDDNYVRWRFKGTYKAVSSPGFNWVWSFGFPLWRPFSCSGIVVIGGGTFDPNPAPVYYGPPLPAGFSGKLSRVGVCTCCTCYVSQFESIPQLSDAQLISGNQFRNITVAQVPINTETFYDKYLVEVEQMSISRKAFEFFKLIRSQKEGASSLFQPPSGEIRGNIKPINSNQTIIGLFYASAIKSKSLFIYRSEVPYLLSEITYSSLPCDSYPNSTTAKPALWP